MTEILKDSNFDDDDDDDDDDEENKIDETAHNEKIILNSSDNIQVFQKENN